VIERVSGVRYRPGHVSKTPGAMQWSVPKPERQARERDAGQVEYRKATRWPELKKELLADMPPSVPRSLQTPWCGGE
jgi:hypothetical protein